MPIRELRAMPPATTEVKSYEDRLVFHWLGRRRPALQRRSRHYRDGGTRMKTRICTWYDTVTPESAQDGDYAETGVNWREDGYDTLVAAADAYVNAVCRANATVPADPILDVAYDDDGCTDYRTGATDFYRVALRIDRRMSERRRTVLRRLIARYARRYEVPMERPYRPRPTLALVVGGN